MADDRAVFQLTDDVLENQKRISAIAADSRGRGVASHEEDWTQNLKHMSGYLLGGVQATLDTVSGGYRERRTKSRSDEMSGEAVEVNLIHPRLARFLARHTNLFDGARVQPATDYIPDIRQAKAASRTIEAMWLNGYERLVMRNLVYMVACGRSYALIEADPNLNMEFTPDGSEPSGGVIKKSLTPMSVDAMPGIQSIHDSDGIVIRESMTGEEIFRRWGVEPEDESEWQPGGYGNAILDELEPELGKVTYAVKRLFIKPSLHKPLGEQHVIIGDKVVHSVRLDPKDKKSPLTIGTWDYKYPLAEFADIPLEFGFHGRGRQTAARTVLKILCANWSRMVQVSVGMPAVTIDADPDIDEQKLNNFTYQFLERGAQGTPIGFNVVPKLPHHESMLQFCIRWLDEIYAQSPPSRGQLPGSRTSGRAVEALIQQDMLADTPTGKLALTAIRETMRRGLGEGLRVWSDPHIESILGEGREAEKIALQTGSLKPGWNIFIVPGNGRPRPLQEQRQEINESVQAGVITPEQGRKLAKYPVDEDVHDPKRHQERIVEMEEEQFAKGFYVEPNPYDDNPFHLEGHNRSAARRHGRSGQMENMQRQRHIAATQKQAGAENQAAFADQIAQAMQQKMEEEAQAQALGIPGPGTPGGGQTAPAAPPAAPQGAPAAA